MDTTPASGEPPGRPQCKGITAKGERCRQFLDLSADGLCLVHDPERADEAAAMRERGGETTRVLHAEREARTVRVDDLPPPMEMTLQGIARYQAWHIQQVAAGRLDKKLSGSLTYGLTLLKACLEKAELEDQLKAARAELARLRPSGPRGVA